MGRYLCYYNYIETGYTNNTLIGETKMTTTTSSVNKYLNNNEAQIITMFCTDAIAKGCTVSVFDGCEFALKRSRDIQKILIEAAATGEDSYRIRDANGEIVGSVYCIYNNGNEGLDVITDYTDSPLMNEILSRANAFIEEMEEAQFN